MAVALLHSALLPSPAESGNAKSQESRLCLFICIAYHFEALYTDCSTLGIMYIHEVADVKVNIEIKAYNKQLLTSVVFPAWSTVIHS